MSQEIAFTDLMIALRNTVLAASTRLNDTTAKVMATYFDTDGQTPKMISIANAASDEIKVPLVAIAPLTALGLNSVAFNAALVVSANNGRLWVRLAESGFQTSEEVKWKEIQASWCIYPQVELAEFLETVKGLEQDLLAEIR